MVLDLFQSIAEHPPPNLRCPVRLDVDQHIQQWLRWFELVRQCHLTHGLEEGGQFISGQVIC